MITERKHNQKAVKLDEEDNPFPWACHKLLLEIKQILQQPVKN